MHFSKISCVLIWSQNYQKLADWYQKVFNFEITWRVEHPDDTGIEFTLPGGNPWLWIGKHSQVKGKNKDPHRIMLNIDVDSIDETYQHLLKHKVKILAEPFKAPTFDKWLSAFMI
ncbi:hypothetical protein COX08_04540 [Candidatus Beckwithbacteria bacterium CG23_combo_of_CG06-09_8_20_14_all_34_8]|uniref:VOC domain-containing protein n=1 Tax=Candidatus Beckwithbacteria bacterium CG23_combo_of_CG06-09_8_20_14_all_34_8 TaxID=1974497 RepID=A0A2H0B527_9BACT|nr:MAG: hypothetical protein COX08_04540 [Candidatus Beckwithbacteria bacterium CG23_combo_of_CG06-09_8_20_14_all_34_8]